MNGIHQCEHVGQFPVASGANGGTVADAMKTPMHFNSVIRFKNNIFALQSGVVWRYGPDTSEMWVPEYQLKSGNKNGITGNRTARDRFHSGMYYYINDNQPYITFMYSVAGATADLLRGVTYNGTTGEWLESDIFDLNTNVTSTVSFLEEWMFNHLVAPLNISAGQVDGITWDPIASGMGLISEIFNQVGNGEPGNDSPTVIYKNRYMLSGRAVNTRGIFEMIGNELSKTQTVYQSIGSSHVTKQTMFTLDNEHVHHTYVTNSTTWEGNSFSASDTPDRFVIHTGSYVYPWGNPYARLPINMRASSIPDGFGRMWTIFDRHNQPEPSTPLAFIQCTSYGFAASEVGGPANIYSFDNGVANSGYWRDYGGITSPCINGYVNVPKDQFGDGSRKFNGNLAYIQVEGTSEGSTEETAKLHFRIYESAYFPSGYPCEAAFLFGPGMNVPLDYLSITSSEQGTVRDSRFITGLTFGSGNLYTCEYNGVAGGLAGWDSLTVIPMVSGVV